MEYTGDTLEMRVCMHIGCHVIGLSDRMMFGVVRVHFVMSLYVRGACFGARRY